MTTLDPTAAALRRSPTVRQEVQIEPATGNLYGIVDGFLRHWNSKGIPLNFAATNDECFLTALQTVREPLRCWLNTYPNNDGDDFLGSAYFEIELARRGASRGAILVPMIEAAELDRVKAAGDALASAWKRGNATTLEMDKAVAAWKEAVK